MNHIVAITGFSASGKDSVARKLEKGNGYNFVISSTSRPIRSNEKDGREYYFKTKGQFQGLIDKNKLVEYRSYETFNNGKLDIWHYGIEKNEIDLNKNSYVVVVDIKGLEQLKKEYGNSIISFFVDVDEATRRKRAEKRDSNFEEKEWLRRLDDDIQIFRTVDKKVDYIIHNYDFDNCYKEILSKIDYKLKEMNFFEQYASY